jgi:pimeloyl-ACP methyl ester carboxylesterase
VERLRVLCLHGYHGSAQILRGQLTPLVEGVDNVAEFIFVDAPSLAVGDFGWWHASAAKTSAPLTDAGIGRGIKRYEGWQRTRDAIVSVFVRQGPFDGMFGFSQGAALAALLAGLRSRDDPVRSGPAGPMNGILGQAEPLTFGFAVMVGGFVAADADLVKLYDDRSNYELPSAHIIGRSDTVVPKEPSFSLAAKFANPLILEHEGGHVISDAPQIRPGFHAFLEEMRQRKKATS